MPFVGDILFGKRIVRVAGEIEFILATFFLFESEFRFIIGQFLTSQIDYHFHVTRTVST